MATFSLYLKKLSVGLDFDVVTATMIAKISHVKTNVMIRIWRGKYLFPKGTCLAFYSAKNCIHTVEGCRLVGGNTTYENIAYCVIYTFIEVLGCFTMKSPFRFKKVG